MNADVIQQLKQLIEEMPVFNDTGCEGEEYLTYHAVELFGNIIVREEWSSKREDSTSYYALDEVRGGLRVATEQEDAILRCADLNDVPFREMEGVVYVTSKGGDTSED